MAEQELTRLRELRRDVPTADLELRYQAICRAWRRRVLEAGPGIVVKCGFATDHPQLNREWMFVELQRIEGDGLFGRLLNHPVYVPGLKHGDTVEIIGEICYAEVPKWATDKAFQARWADICERVTADLTPQEEREGRVGRATVMLMAALRDVRLTGEQTGDWPPTLVGERFWAACRAAVESGGDEGQVTAAAGADASYGAAAILKACRLLRDEIFAVFGGERGARMTMATVEVPVVAVEAGTSQEAEWEKTKAIQEMERSLGLEREAAAATAETTRGGVT